MQGLHKILPANLGGTLDKSRFSGNKSLQGKNDLRKTVRAGASAREFHVGGNSPLPPARRRPCFVSYFSSSMEEPGRKLRPLCVMDCTKSYRQNPWKTLDKSHFSGNKSLQRRKQQCPRPRNARRFPQRKGATRKGLANGGPLNVAGLGKNGWLICPKDFSGIRFNLVSQWISVTTAIDHVLTHVFHRQWESLTENPARFARKSHRIIPAKSGQNP